MAKRWQYTAGRKGHNRVQVYEREPDGPLWYVWYPRGVRVRKPLSDLTGEKVFDKNLAMQIADLLAAKQDKESREVVASTVLGLAPRHTLGELLAKYHEQRGPRWKPSNKKNMERLRAYWLSRLGKDTRITSIKAPDANTIAHKDAIAKKWTPRTEAKHLRYLRTAFSYARKKLKWIDEKHDLSGLDIPTADGRGKSYETHEVRAILRASPDVDLRMAVAAWVAYVSLRRITAIRMLKAKVRVEARKVGRSIVRIGWVHFPREHDKAGKSRDVAIAGEALEYLEKLLQTSLVKSSGYLFPAGDLMEGDKGAEPVSYDVLHGWLQRAEELAGVENVTGRAWHAFKHASTTDSRREMGNLSAASDQAGTSEKTLDNWYAEIDPDAQALLATRLAARVTS